jgi:hypothetical protein
MPEQRLPLTAEQRELIDDLREQVRDTAEAVMTETELEYTYAVIDTLAWVWSGCIENAGEAYRATNSRFAQVMRRAGL